MKKICAMIFLIFSVFSVNAFSGKNINPNCFVSFGNFPTLQSKLNKNICIKTTKEQEKLNNLARRGCCSWHRGVCGCSGGRAVCCDGVLLPTCGC